MEMKMYNRDNVILIGMPGAGKSTVGVVLAKNMGYRFLDSDLVIQEETGKLLHEIISSEGLSGFLRVENDVNRRIDTHHSIIATGGSVVYGEEAMAHLSSIGTLVYLKLSCGAIAERLGDLKKRGVAFRDGQSLEDLYEERTPLYEKYADLVIDCEKKGIRSIVLEIAEQMER